MGPTWPLRRRTGWSLRSAFAGRHPRNLTFGSRMAAFAIRAKRMSGWNDPPARGAWDEVKIDWTNRRRRCRGRNNACVSRARAEPEVLI
jgi:hypothetical protein